MALFINLTNKLVYVDHQEDPKGFMRLYMQKTYGDIGLWIKTGICILRVTIYASFINLYLDPE